MISYDIIYNYVYVKATFIFANKGFLLSEHETPTPYNHNGENLVTVIKTNCIPLGLTICV